MVVSECHVSISAFSSRHACQLGAISILCQGPTCLSRHCCLHWGVHWEEAGNRSRAEPGVRARHSSIDQERLNCGSKPALLGKACYCCCCCWASEPVLACICSVFLFFFFFTKWCLGVSCSELQTISLCSPRNIQGQPIPWGSLLPSHEG